VSNPSSQQHAPLILVVDDDRLVRKLLKVAMQEEGYRVAEAQDGKQCLAEYNRLQPDMVLLDAIMPEMDGFTCCQKLRDLSGNAHTPILMITALDDQDSIERAFTVGATDYTTKPIYWAVLSQRVKRLLEMNQTLAQLEQTQYQSQQLQAWQQLLGKLTRQLCQPCTLQFFLEMAIANVRQLMRSERVFLRSRQGKLHFESLAPGYASLETLSWEAMGWRDDCAKSYPQGQAIAISALSQADVPTYLAAQLTSLQTQAALLVPIKRQDRLWGVLGIHYCQAEHTWLSWEVDQAIYVSDLIALALYRND
jgi:CheY-like chemotaxis protein